MNPEGKEQKKQYPTDEELFYEAAQFLSEENGDVKHALMRAVAPHFSVVDREEKVDELLKFYNDHFSKKETNPQE